MGGVCSASELKNSVALWIPIAFFGSCLQALLLCSAKEWMQQFDCHGSSTQFVQLHRITISLFHSLGDTLPTLKHSCCLCVDVFTTTTETRGSSTGGEIQKRRLSELVISVTVLWCSPVLLFLLLFINLVKMLFNEPIVYAGGWQINNRVRCRGRGMWQALL